MEIKSKEIDSAFNASGIVKHVLFVEYFPPHSDANAALIAERRAADVAEREAAIEKREVAAKEREYALQQLERRSLLETEIVVPQRRRGRRKKRS